MNRVPRFAWMGCLLIGLLPMSADAGFTQIVSFGDSLSDTGNVFLASATPPAPYYQGHYSNGPIWLEYLATKLGVAAPTPSLAGGTDYAFGGAQTGTGLSFLNTPNIGSQIATYLGTNPTINGGQLFTVWGGANDFLNGGVTDPNVPLANLAAEITALANAGARNFLVPNLPQLGDLPATNGLPALNRGQLNGLTQLFNAGLTTTLNQLQSSLGVTIDRVNVNGLVQSALANPSAFGFTNVTDPAFDATKGTVAANNGAGYLFWDTVHPTTAGQMLVANTSFAAVPEPSSMILMTMAGGCLLLPAVRGLRRRAA